MASQWLAFHLTDRCQLDCSHCLRDPSLKARDVPLALVQRVLEEARRLYRVGHVALTGGEPMLHPQFAAVLDAVVAQGMGWHMVTNGRKMRQLLALLEERPERREALTALDFSLDGATEEVHDGIRGRGSYRDVLSAAVLAQAARIPFMLQMTVHAQNQHQLEEMGLLASSLGAGQLSFSMAQPTGTLHDARMFLSAADWRRVQDRIARLRDALKLPVSSPEGFWRQEPFTVCEPMRSQQLHVDVHGRLNLCCQHSGVPDDGSKSDVAGDLNQVSLLTAHQSLLRIIHDAQAHRLKVIQDGPLEEWDHFPCNACMKSFGKPHWTAGGAAGPGARRERWRGAWSPEQQQLKGAAAK